MAIMATDTGGGDFKRVPAGNHLALCNMVADLGKQRIEWQGETKLKHQVYIRWELPDEQMEWTDREGNERKGPMVIGKTYTLSLHENAGLRADLENWRGRAFTEEERKGFDIAKLAGVPCMLNVVHTEKNGKTYANVGGVAALPKSMPRPNLYDSAIIYDDEHLSAFEMLPEWLQKKVQEQVVDQKPTQDLSDLDDEVPF